MKKLHILGAILLAFAGFAAGWFGFNFAAEKVEDYIDEYGMAEETPTGEDGAGKEKKPEVFIKIEEWTQYTLTANYAKHLREFPEYKSAGEYKSGSEKFFRSPPAGTEIKINEKGERLYYHEKSNTFGVITGDGVPKTFFRPEKGNKYWKRQPGKFLKKK